MLKVKGQTSTGENKVLPQLPVLAHKGGSTIIQNWNTKKETPKDIADLNLPIIYDRNKVNNALPELTQEVSYFGKEKSRMEDM